MDCCTTATRRNKTFAVLHSVQILRPLPTVLLHVISDYSVVPFLAGCSSGQIWIRESDDEQQPWRRGFSNLVLPDWPVAMATANDCHLLVLQPPLTVDAIVTLPLCELPNHTKWRKLGSSSVYWCWRLFVLSCGTPIVLQIAFEQVFLYFRTVRHPVPVHLCNDNPEVTTTVIWHDCLVFIGGSQPAMWNPITTEWHLLPPLSAATGGFAMVTPIGLLRASALEPFTLIECLPSPLCSSWTVLDFQLPVATRKARTWFINERLYFAPWDISNRCWSLCIRQDQKIQTSDWIQEPNTPQFLHVFTL